MLHLQRFTLPFEYPVYFTEDAFDPKNPVLEQAILRREPGTRRRVAVVLERRVGELWPKLEAEIAAYVAARGATLELLAIRIADGEETCKKEADVAELHRWFNALGLDRHATVLAIGGGAFLDMAGYAAATAHRGLRIVRMPTTVLGQNDSGIGVKNGINAFGKKNFLGTFSPPFAVICDRSFLRTLSERDRIAGHAEAVKVALIRDASFFQWLTEHAAALRAFDPGATATAVERCARLHLSHIATSGDPFELGSARPLDYGHWVAHKLESMSQYRIRHGEAVAVGLALDSRYSVQVGLLAETEGNQVIALLEALGFQLWHELLGAREPGGRLTVLAGLEEFREHLGGELTVTLLDRIGHGIEVHAIDASEVEAAIVWLAERRPTCN